MKEKIDRFMACRKLAVAGVSRKSYKSGSAIYRELKKKNYDIVPVSPHMDSFEGEKCYRSVAELPDDIDGLILSVKPEQGLAVVQDAAARGIRHIFVQLGANSDEMVDYAEKNGINLVSKQCIFMFAQPTGIHKFHERISKLFGFYPK